MLWIATSIRQTYRSEHLFIKKKRKILLIDMLRYRFAIYPLNILGEQARRHSQKEDRERRQMYVNEVEKLRESIFHCVLSQFRIRASRLAGAQMKDF